MALVGVVIGDVVTLDTRVATGTFAGSAIGSNIPVTVSGLRLAGPQAADYSLTQPTTTANITIATAKINSISQLEGTSGLTPFVFQIKLPSGGSSVGPVTYDVFTTDGTAKAGVNYVGITAGDAAHGGTVTFAQGSNYATLTVYVIAGSFAPAIGSATKIFTVNLSDPLNPSVALASATGTIIAQVGIPVANEPAETPAQISNAAIDQLFAALAAKKIKDEELQ